MFGSKRSYARKLELGSAVTCIGCFRLVLAQVLLVTYWAVCSGLAVMAVNVQIQGQQQASTVVRKYFHILAVVVFIPGVIRECCFLYLATGVVLALITALEVRKYL
jgi:dolichol kinase